MSEERDARVKKTAENTAAIERCYWTAVNRCLKTLHEAIVEATTHTLPSEHVESQQAHIARLKSLKAAFDKGSENPLGHFNFDFV